MKRFAAVFLCAVLIFALCPGIVGAFGQSISVQSHEMMTSSKINGFFPILVNVK